MLSPQDAAVTVEGRAASRLVRAWRCEYGRRRPWRQMADGAAAGGALRCVQRLRPQLLDDDFVRRWPGFWQQPAHEQERLVREAYGAGANLGVPHEVVEVRLHEASGLLALVGVHRVSVLVLPPLASVSAPTDSADELSDSESVAAVVEGIPLTKEEAEALRDSQLLSPPAGRVDFGPRTDSDCESASDSSESEVDC